MPKKKDTLDPRVLRTVRNYLGQLRQDLDVVFKDCTGDLSAVGCYMIQQVLGRGELYQVLDTDRHVLIRLAWAGVDLDCDLFAEHMGGKEPVRIAYADKLYDEDLIPFAQARLTEEDLEMLERKVKSSGEAGYAALLPQLRQMRSLLRKQRSTLA